MTTYSLIFSCLTALPLGLFFLILGLHITKRKPILVLPKTLGKGMFLWFLPMLIMMVYGIGVDSLNFESITMSLTVTLRVFSTLIGSYAALMFLSTRVIWMFNVAEVILIEGWCEALQKHGIEYSLNQRTGLGAFPGLSRVIVSLPELGGSIKVTFFNFGRAWMSFRGKRRIQNYDTLVSDFRCALAVKEYKGATAAFFFLLGATLGIGGPIAGIISVLLK